MTEEMTPELARAIARAKSVIVGTGHRPDKLNDRWHPGYYKPVLPIIADAIATHVEHWGPSIVVEGDCEGWDHMLGAGALIAKDRGVDVELVVAVPFAGSQSRFKTDEARRWSEKMRARAVFARPVSQIHGDYSGRNWWMVTRPKRWELPPGHLWTCWDGKPGRGTSMTVRYAMKMDPPLLIDNSWYEVVREALGVPIQPYE